MTVHKAKGLEFRSSSCRHHGGPRRQSQPIRRRRARALLATAGGCGRGISSSTKTMSSRATAPRVCACLVRRRARRDLLVVPAVGDDPFAPDGTGERRWIGPVHAAVYPRRSDAGVARRAGLPGVRHDSVLERLERDTPGRDKRPSGPARIRRLRVCGGSEAPCAGLQRVYGLRREDLIQDPGREIVDADRERYDRGSPRAGWLTSRAHGRVSVSLRHRVGGADAA